MDNIEVEVDGTRFTPLPLEDQLNKIKIILKGHKVYENVVVHDIGRGFTTSAIKIGKTKFYINVIFKYCL